MRPFFFYLFGGEIKTRNRREIMHLNVSYIGPQEATLRSQHLDDTYRPLLGIYLYFELKSKPLGFDIRLSPGKSTFKWASDIPF
jgi:hypothetical protein